MRKTFGGGDSLREGKLDTLGFHELEKAFAVSAHVAVDFGQGGEVFAFGLADILSRDLRPSLCAPDASRLWMYFLIVVERRWLLCRFTRS
jgi:hypothetical protein